jgi:aminoglycoside phosphotransferase (APT) family kinase protein
LFSIDLPGEVKSDQSVDVSRLSAYLRSVIPGLPEDIALAQFPSGHSNLTYLVTAGGRELVLKREPPGAKAKSAHDMGREFHILSKLYGKYPFAPEAFHYCQDDNIIGGKFCVMERLAGVIVRRDYPSDGSINTEQIQSQFCMLIDAMASLHLLNVADVGLKGFGRPEGYRRRQVEGWQKRLVDAKTQDMPDFAEVMSWLNAKMPRDPEVGTVVHNDFKMDNLVWSPSDVTKLVGVLDWEMATVGDPLIDLACTLSFWTQLSDPVEFRALRGMPSARLGVISRADAIDRYSRLTNCVVKEPEFYLCFGFFRRAVIEQQKYVRFVRADTSDPRFSKLNEVVLVLRDMCLRVMGGATAI